MKMHQQAITSVDAEPPTWKRATSMACMLTILKVSCLVPDKGSEYGAQTLEFA